MVEAKERKLATAAGEFVSYGGPTGDFYFPQQAALGLAPEKLIIPKNYHRVIAMCYDFYNRGGVVATVINRLTELAITEITNGQRKTSNEANAYFEAVLHRNPSRLNRFIHQAALEYFLSGMVVPRIGWKEMTGADISPDLVPAKMYAMPTFDLYPPKLVQIEWAGWGEKNYYLKIPQKDLKILQNSSGGAVKLQQRKTIDTWVQNFPEIMETITSGGDSVLLNGVDPILRKEVSVTPYPTPYIFNILEPLIFKQQLRRMDFAVASRVINAILLIQEGDADFPEVDGTGIDELKKQVMGRVGDPRAQERVFMLFTNHTTKMTWISPDVAAMLDQDKYRETNEEISEGLGFAKILLTGESRNSQASEVSTWAIQPMMEELRGMFIEFMNPIYEMASELNKFRYTPEPTFSPIRLQDFIKTAAVYAQLFKEGNISRTTRNIMAGIKFEDETELIKDESELIKEIPKNIPSMPYDITDPANAIGPAGGGPGRPPAAPKGGRPIGSQNVPVNNRNSKVKPKGQQPTSRVAASVESNDFTVDLDDEQFIDYINQTMNERGLILDINDEGGLEFRNREG